VSEPLAERISTVMISRALPHSLVLTVVVGWLCGAAPGAARAADDEAASADALSEVVVYAQKRSENIQKVPVSVTAVSADQLESSGIVTTATLSQTIPGLAIANSQSSFQPRLRGIGTALFGPGIENPVGLYVDNVYYSSQLIAPTDLSDIGQIAVLKGPQGTLFGRNSTGGVIQMSTLAPQAEPGLIARTELDNYLTSRNFLYLTAGLTDTVRANVSVKYTVQDHGWGTNLTNGDDVDKTFADLSLRSRWDWFPTDGTTFKFGVDYTTRRDSFGPNFRLYNVPGFTGYFPGVGSTIFPSNFYDVTAAVTDHNRLRQGGANLEASQDLGFARLVSITAWRKYSFDGFSDVNGSIPRESLVYNHPVGDQLSEELQLLSKDTSPVQWVAGAYYFYGRDILAQSLLYYDYFAQNFFQFDGATRSSFVHSDFLDNLKTDSRAVYGQLTAPLGWDSHVTAGLRYTSERRSIAGPTTTFIDGVMDEDPANTYLYDEHYKSHKLTWRFALDHEFTRDLLGYASYNRGFKSGGFNAFFLAPPYSPEVVDAYEAGLKSEFLDHRLRVNVAGFFNKYSNIQLLIVSNFSLLVKNAADSHTYGADADIEFKATDALTLRGGAEWLHARFTNFPALPYSVPLAGGGLGQSSFDPTLPVLNGAGRALPYAPNLTTDLAADYTVSLPQGRVVLNVTDSYSDGYFFEPDNVARQPSFNLVNTSATWTSADDHLSIGVFCRNLTNKAVPNFVAATAPTGFTSDYATPPRTYGLTAQYRFGSTTR
jgi:iron complex outermembrane recepter protein